MPTNSAATSVRSLERGLAILQAVNRSAGIKAGEVARELGLPRPTVYRLLETLEELGFISRSANDDRFRVTLRARLLSDGFEDPAQLIQIASREIAGLSRQLVWPFDISTYEDGFMIVRETTHARSPLSIDRGMISYRLPLLHTASGRTYLAFSEPAARSAIVDHLRHIDDPADRPLLTDAALTQMIEMTQRRGYGTRLGESFIPKTSSIAVPVIAKSGVLASLTVIWITSAMSLDRALQQFLGPMQDAARRIAEAVNTDAGLSDRRTPQETSLKQPE